MKDAAPNNIIEVFVSGEGTYEYALFDENNVGIYRDFQDSNVFENVFPGIYTINVKDIKNDCGTVDNLVSVIGFRSQCHFINTLSPNAIRRLIIRL